MAKNTLEHLNDPSRVAILNQKGERVTIPLDQREEALSRGYTDMSGDEFSSWHDEIEQDSFGNETLSALAGAARGLTFGISDQVLTGTDLVSPETLRKFKQHSPITSIGGEMVGAVAPIIFSGGAGAVAGGARLAPTALLAKGILGTERAIAGNMTRGINALSTAAKGGSRLAETVIAKGLSKKLVQVAMKQAPKVASQALEGALYGAGQAISEDALGEKELNAESLLSSMGTGALFGAAIPAIVSPALSLTAHGARKAGESLKKVALSLEDIILSNIKGAGHGAGGLATGAVTGTAAALSAVDGGILSAGLAGAAGGLAGEVAGEAALRSAKLREPFLKYGVKPAASTVGSTVRGVSSSVSGVSGKAVKKGTAAPFTAEGKAAREFIHQSDEEFAKYADDTAKSIDDSIRETEKLADSLDSRFDEIYGEEPLRTVIDSPNHEAFIVEDASVLGKAIDDLSGVKDKAMSKELEELSIDYFEELADADNNPIDYYRGIRKTKLDKGTRVDIGVDPEVGLPVYESGSRQLGSKLKEQVVRDAAIKAGKVGVELGAEAAIKAVDGFTLTGAGWATQAALKGIKPSINKWIKKTQLDKMQYFDDLAKNNPSINQKYVEKLHKIARKAEQRITKAGGFAQPVSGIDNYKKLQWMKDNPSHMKWEKATDNFGAFSKRKQIEMLENVTPEFREGPWKNIAWANEAINDKHVMQEFFKHNSDKTFINVAESMGADSYALDDFVKNLGGWDNIVVKHRQGITGTINGVEGTKGVILDWNKATKAQKALVEANPTEWFVEKKLDLVDEFRVVLIGDKPTLVKHRWGSPGIRKATDKLGAPSLENMINVSDDAMKAKLEAFGEKVSRETPFMTTGMDVGLTRDGELFLIELQPGYGTSSPGMKKMFNDTLGDPRFTKSDIADDAVTLRQHLDSDLYGAQGKEWNKIAVAREEWQKSKNTLLESFPLLEDDLISGSKINPTKLREYLKTLGVSKDKASQHQTQVIKDYLEKSNRLMEVNSMVDKTKAVQSADAFTKYVDRLDDVAVRNELQAFSQKNPMMHDLGYLALAGAIGGPIGGGIALTARSIGNPKLASQALYMVEKGVTTIKNQIDNGVINAITSPIKAVGDKAAKTIAPAKKLPMTPIAAIQGLNWKTKNEKKEQELQDMYSEKITDIDNLLENNAIDRVSNATAGLSHFAPNISESLQEKAMFALNYLKEKAPVNPYLGTMLEDKWAPSSTEIAKWARVARVVENPLTVLDDINNGGLPVEAVQALKDVYPQLYTQIVAGFIDKADEIKKLPYQKQLQINQFLGTMDTAPVPSGKSQEQEGKPQGKKIKIDRASDMVSDVTRVANQ